MERKSQLFLSLTEEAPFIDGEIEPFIPPLEIPWFSPKLWKEGQAFVRRNYSAILLAQFSGFVFSTLANKPGIAVTVQVGRDWFLRSVGSAKRILSWYESDLGETSEGFKSMKTVRNLHKKYGKPIIIQSIPEANEGENSLIPSIQECVEKVGNTVHCLDWCSNSSVQFSQRDLWVVQFEMTFAIILSPEKMGVKKGEDFKGFLHMWAVFGRLFGLKDEYNLALHGDTKLYKILMQDVFLPSLKTADRLNISSFQNLIQDFNKATKIPLLRPLPVLYFLMTIAATGFSLISVESLQKKLGCLERLFLKIMGLVTLALSKFGTVRLVLNSVARKVVKLVIRFYDFKTGRKQKGWFG